MSFLPPPGNVPPSRPPGGAWPPPAGSSWPPPPGSFPAPPPPPAPAPRRSRRPLVIGLIGGLVLLVIVIGAATLASRARRGTPLDDLRRGDCFILTDGVFGQKAERVRCSDRHTDEVAGLLHLPGGRGARYPGTPGILELGQQGCPAQVSEFYGSKAPAPAETFVSGPDRAAWKSGQRSVVCSLREPSAARRRGSYRDG